MSVNRYDPTTGLLTPVAGTENVVFGGATASTDGTRGLVPAPQSGDEDKFLKANGTWDKAAADDNYVGTLAAWNLMSDTEKAQYKTCDFTDDVGNIGIGLHVVNGQLYCRYRVHVDD